MAKKIFIFKDNLPLKIDGCDYDSDLYKAILNN